MKKLITLILALVTVMTSLTACGNSAPAKTEDEDDDDRIVTHAPASNGTDGTSSIFVPDSLPATDTEAPKPELFLLAGTWKEIPTDAASDPESFTITDSGELNTKTLKGGKLTTDKDKIEFTDNMSLSFKFNKLVMTYSFKLVDGKFIAYTSSATHYNYFYREADFADYEAITLTKDNAAQYIEGYNTFMLRKDAYGEVSLVSCFDHIRFKEGVGAPSWIYGEFNYESMFVEGVLDTADGSFTQGAEVAARISHDFIKKVSVSGAGEFIVPQYGYGVEFEKLDGTKVKIKKVDVENFLSAEKVVGVVFVKKS